VALLPLLEILEIDPCIEESNLQDNTPEQQKISPLSLSFVSQQLAQSNDCNNALNVYPNPIQNEANIGFYLSEPSEAEISILTINGQFVSHVMPKQWMDQGIHTIGISPNSLPKGIYLCSMKNKHCKVSKKIIIN